MSCLGINCIPTPEAYAKIRATMDDLDEKKREALEITWKKVDKDFGSIFSTLLPGTMAKLEPVDNKTAAAKARGRRRSGAEESKARGRSRAAAKAPANVRALCWLATVWL